MKEYDKKTLENIKARFNAQTQPCGRFNLEEFDEYQLDLLSSDRAQELAQHAKKCDNCREYLRQLSRMMDTSKLIADAFPDEPLMNNLRAHLDEVYAADMRQPLLAAATEKAGTAGKAYGVAAAEKGGTGKVIECEAFVQSREKSKGQLKILGLRGDRDVLDHLEEKMTNVIFPSCLDLRDYNLDRRIIGVDLDENLFSTAESLSLSVIMAIINAIHQRTENPPFIYAADVETFGNFKKVSKIPEKIDVAVAQGYRHFIFSTENRADIPQRHLDNPNLRFWFFSNIRELLTYHAINLPDREPLMTGGAGTNLETSTRATGPILQTRVIADGNVTPILDYLEIDSDHREFWRRLMAFSEDLVHTGDFHDELGTAILLGPQDEIEGSLPEIIFKFAENPQVFDLAGIMEDLAELIDGQRLCFVLDPLGLVTSVRCISPVASHSGAACELLTAADCRMAALTNYHDTRLLYLPPFQDQVKLFRCGALAARYANGQWRLTDYAALNTLLQELARKKQISWLVIKAAAQAAISMAERGQGGIFAFVRDEKTAQNMWWSGLINDFGLTIQNPEMHQLDAEFLSILARPKGAVILNYQGHLVAVRSFFKTKEPTGNRITSSARHRAAQQFSAEADSLCIVASRYGTISIYEKGQRLAQI
jgi:hypothetical protein